MVDVEFKSSFLLSSLAFTTEKLDTWDLAARLKESHCY